MLRILFLFVFALATFSARADHAMGGEITWKCNGNGYIFELIFYRDCNGADINTISETIEVWNHPSITSIPVLFVSRQDISPTCSQVAGSAAPLTCGSGTGGGSGIGAVEKAIYRSAPIILPGVPPANGWIFTYDIFSRNGNISNLQNPITYGLTISATMFPGPSTSPGICTDNSVQFYQDPYFISCVGDAYEYNLHPVDIDLDSIHMVFGTPYDDFTGTYNPPSNPIPVPFEIGYSVNSPTPDATFAAGNIAANLNPVNGNLTFTSNTVGSFVIKVQAESYRLGVKIAVVEREMQIYVVNCAGNNTAPDVVGPFAGSFNTTVTAGTLVNFNFSSTDVELLQDGTPQSNALTATGMELPATCTIGPCAALNPAPIVTGIQGSNTNFSWQTDCAHVPEIYGRPTHSVDYTFVFKVQDNYCQIPKATYKTITITVVSPDIIPATDITCITTATNSDVTLTWDPVTDPAGTFAGYKLYSLQTGLIGTYPIGTTTTTVPSPGQALDFYISVASGCNGNAELNSDTLENVFLALSNPANGTAVLDWNTPINPALPMFGTTCDVQREYPTGTWTTIATLPYATTHFLDTIDICQAFLNYRIVYNTPTCFYNSNIEGDIFEDMQTPDIPLISSVSVDTTTGNMTVNWNVNHQSDTKGYVIYWKDPNGFIVEIDTVYGINNTTYNYTGPITGPLTFSVAAFDSCYTPGTNPTYQTSAKAELHTSMFVSQSLNKCNAVSNLSWTPYVGWTTGLVDYTVFAQQNGGAWTNLGNTTSTTFPADLVQLSNYCIVIRANKSDGTESFSNKICFLVNGPTPPAINYLRVATVENDNITLRHEISTGSNVSSVKLQKYNPLNSTFENLVTLPATASTLTYIDTNVDVHYTSYTYRAIVIDSCGFDGAISNVARTVFLKVTTDQNTQVNYLNWSSYIDYDGGVLEYQVYRGIDGFFDSSPFANLPPTQRFIEDDISQLPSNTGKFCYYVNAYEAFDQYGFHESSFSNVECIALTPLVYIPNAFTPDGYNPIFKPVITFSDVSKYEFSVVDRWGQVLFQTTDLNEGWDGKHPNNDHMVTNDVFMYVVKVVDGNNQEYYYRGTVTVVK